MAVHHVVNQADFDKQIAAAGDKVTFVDFFATWCGPCIQISPIFENLAQKYAANLIALAVDVDQCEDLAMHYNISVLPTFVAIKRGNRIDSFSGSNPELLEQFIHKHIG